MHNHLFGPLIRGYRSNIEQLTQATKGGTHPLSRIDKAFCGLKASLYSIAFIITSIVCSLFIGIAAFVHLCKRKKYVGTIVTPLLIPLVAIGGIGIGIYGLAKGVVYTTRAFTNPETQWIYHATVVPEKYLKNSPLGHSTIERIWELPMAKEADFL
jgi:hypothetical protein